jgi:hypothetical protein
MTLLETIEAIANEDNWQYTDWDQFYWIGESTPQELALRAVDEYKHLEARLFLYESAFSRMQGIFPFDLYEICPELRDDEEDEDE